MSKEKMKKAKEYFTNWNPVLYQNHPERLVSTWEIEQDKCTKNKMNILLDYIQQLEEREEKVKEIIEPVQGLQCFDFNVALNILTKILNLYKEK